MKKQDTVTRLIQSTALLGAIGREKSFSKAAEQLGIDQSAVSHRIKSLEEAIGFALFNRTTRSLSFTKVGEILCSTANDSLGRWEKAINRIEQVNKTDQIRLSLSSSLAMKWLMHILPSAYESHLDLSINTNEDVIDFERDDIDAAIRFGIGPFPGHYAVKLSNCFLQPVVSPRYINDQELDSHHINAPVNLDELLLNPNTAFLADTRGKQDNTQYNWKAYFDKANLTFNSDAIIHQFDRADLLLQGVISGMGVGLGRTLLIEEDIKAGFVRPLGKPVLLDSSYWLVCSYSFAETERFKQLQKWLKKQVNKN